MAGSYYFDGKSSKRHNVAVRYEAGLIRGLDEAGSEVFLMGKEQCTVAPPLGSAPRTVGFANGGSLYTDDSKLIKRLETDLKINRQFNLIHLLERHWKSSLACLLALLLFVGGTLRYGVPLMAEYIAKRTPDILVEKIREETMDHLDGYWLQPSRLSGEKQRHVQMLFDTTRNMAFPNGRFELLLRSSRLMGANAFALPAGIVIMTDALVEMSDSDLQIQSVFIHEMQHAFEAHGLRSVLQNSGVFLLISLMVGDIASITATAATLPTLVIQSRYSQSFEKDADLAVVRVFKQQGWDVAIYADFLESIVRKGKGANIPSWLSSHPDIEDRVALIKSH